MVTRINNLSILNKVAFLVPVQVSGCYLEYSTCFDKLQLYIHCTVASCELISLTRLLKVLAEIIMLYAKITDMLQYCMSPSDNNQIFSPARVTAVLVAKFSEKLKV